MIPEEKQRKSSEAINFQIMNQLTLQKIKERAARKKRLEVYFLVVSDGKFVYDSIYENMKRSDCFDTKCLLIHKRDMEFSTNDRFIKELLEEKAVLEKQGYEVVVPYDRFWNPIEFEHFGVDILFLYASYLETEPCYFRHKIVSPNYLTCFVNYAMRNVNLDDWMYNNRIVNWSWINFVESYQVAKLFYQKSFFGVRNVVVSGYPKLDKFVAGIRNEKEKTNKTVIYAPHWSMHNKGWLNLSTFHLYFDYFERLMDEHKDIKFVFKPHPDLQLHLRKLAMRGVQTEISEHEYVEYVERWNNKENGKVYLGSDYIGLFLEADCMITDCGSFTSEWLPSRKPCIYLFNPENEDSYEIFNPLGKEILNTYYICHNKEEIDETFEKVVISGNDSKRDERLHLLEKEYVNLGHAGEFIVEYVRKQIFD